MLTKSPILIANQLSKYEYLLAKLTEFSRLNCYLFLLLHTSVSKVKRHWLTAAVIPAFITGHPVITKWGDYSTFDITIIAINLSEQPWEYF